MNGHVIKINKLTPPLTPLNDEAFVFCVETICAMTSFNYYDQNPSGFFFLVRIKALVFLTSLELPNLNMKEKRKGFWS